MNVLLPGKIQEREREILSSKNTCLVYQENPEGKKHFSLRMGFANSVGKYQLGRIIGEGTFAKVKLAMNTVNGQQVAIKIIDKQMVIENNLIYQAKIFTNIFRSCIDILGKC